jgi:hypothetical protein
MPVVWFKAPSDMVVKPVVIVELRERELDEWEYALVAREHGLVETVGALGRVCMECHCDTTSVTVVATVPEQ